MNADTAAVLAGTRRWSVEQGDCLEWLKGLPDDAVSLCFGSPPYEAQRTYGVDFKLKGQAWVDWMVAIYQECLRVCTGLVAFVVEGHTKDRRYSCVPALLMADLHRAGVCLRKPPVFHRVGIPGSGGARMDHEANGGGADWLRNDWEWIICATRGGKLPWADATACGHKPKYGVGGEVSYRTLDGVRVNEKKRAQIVTTQRGTSKNGGCGDAQTVKRSMLLPVKANPGNVLRYKVGGGHLGSPLSHLNEAPFPNDLARFFILSFCALGAVCCDPFAGSGTTLAVAVEHGRLAIGCDIRESQVLLSRRRIEEVTPVFPEMA